MGNCNILKAGSGGLDTEELTAVAADVLTGKTAGISGADGPVTGTMPNRGAVTQSLNAGSSYTIPAGYHNGSGKVIANNLSSQTSANATAAQILSGQSSWVNGAKITGSMPNRGTVNQTLAINGSYTIPSGYHNGSGKITQSIPVQGGSTTTPGTSNKTVVTANRYVNGNVVVAGSGNLIAGNIKKGINIFGITGTHDGYVALAGDLYNRGTQGSIGGGIAGATSTIIFDSGQITFKFARGSQRYVYNKLPINFTGYKTIKVECSFTGGGNSENSPSVILLVTREQTGSGSTLASMSRGLKGVSEGTLTPLDLDISSVNATGYIRIGQGLNSVTSLSGAIYRISIV